MNVDPEKLAQHLNGILAPLYVVGGEEPLQIEESLDLIRAAARKQGFDERIVMHVDANFDWDTLQAGRDSMSLFSERRILDLRLPTGKPGADGAKALTKYAGGTPDPDTMLIVSLGDFEGRGRQAKWYKTLAQAGTTVHCWPVDANGLPKWIAQRAASRGWSIDTDAAAELAVRTEGNLLACAQEVELLGMLCDGKPIDLALILAFAADSARFGNFDLVDAALDGDGARTVRIIRGLEREGTVAVVVAGTLGWLIRGLATFAHAVEQGQSVERAIGGNPVWKRRQAGLSKALRRHSAGFWPAALVRLRHIDAMAKGASRDDPWQALLALTVQLAGHDILRTQGPTPTS